MRVSEESAKIYSKDFDNVASDYKNSLQQAFKDLPESWKLSVNRLWLDLQQGLQKIQIT